MMEKEILIAVGKKLTYSFFSRKHANAVMRGVRYANQVFGGLINGKIIDSFIIGALCYLFMTVVQYDYAVLISMIVGVTNIIPYFGPFIGAIPSALILLMMDVKQGIIASKIAAHAADIAKHVPHARDIDDKMADARRVLDWDKQWECAIDPETAKSPEQKNKFIEQNDDVISVVNSINKITDNK